MSNQKETVVDLDYEETQKLESINISIINITHYSRLQQFIICTIAIFVCYLLYGFYLEIIYSDPDVKPVAVYFTFVQFIMTMLLSFSESQFKSPIKRKVPMRTYFVLAALTLGTMALSNMALVFLNYPTQLIFKSCKPLPVMIGSIIIMGKRYNFLDYVAAILMCFGLTMFTLADFNTSPKFNLMGVFIISQALVCDAIIGNLQEKAMKQFQAPNNEVVFYSYAIGSAYLFVIVLITGDLVDGFKFCATDPVGYYGEIYMLSFSGYVGLQAVLSLVRICGATVAVTVTTLRKAISICISFILFGKPFVFQYLWSGLLIVFSIYLTQYSKKHPGYVPGPLLKICPLISAMYTSEYRYLQMRSKSITNTV